MAKHSCGHVASLFMDKDTVRRLPLCTDCAERKRLEQKLDKKATELALLYPTKSADDIADMLTQRAGTFRGERNLYKLIAAADDIMAEHAANDIDSMEVNYVEPMYSDKLV